MTGQGMIQWHVTLPHNQPLTSGPSGHSYRQLSFSPNGSRDNQLNLNYNHKPPDNCVMPWFIIDLTNFWKYIIRDKAQGADNKENLTFSSQSLMIFGNYLAPCTHCRGQWMILGPVLGKLSATKVSNDNLQHQILQTNHPPLDKTWQD